MTDSAALAPAPMTRRQMREIERREEAARARAAVSPSLPPRAEAPKVPALSLVVSAPSAPEQATAAAPTTTAAPAALRVVADELDQVAPVADRIPMGAEPSETPTITLEAARSRRALREAEKAAAAAQKPHIGRAAVLGSLGVVTIAGPLTGFAGTDTAAQAAAAGIVAETPVLDVAAGSAGRNVLEGSVSTGEMLMANPTAMVMAAGEASRNGEREVVSACETVVAATGTTAVNIQVAEELTRPMAAGTYRDTSLYGPRWGSFHNGTDMAAPVGTPLYAVASGEVVHAGEGIEGRSGNLVIIHSVVNGQDVWFWYGHMYDDGVYVTEGQQVHAGEVIGGVGNKGFSTGPHLHFEIHSGSWDNHVNPLTWLSNNGASFPGQC